MTTIDNDCAIRDLAYLLWERAGRPSGLEHEHWAEARHQIEADGLRVARIEVADVASRREAAEAQPVEIVRLREALYTPEPFSFELFGAECPAIDCPLVIQKAA